MKVTLSPRLWCSCNELLFLESVICEYGLISQTKGRSDQRKRERKRKGKKKGKLEVKFWQKRKKLQTHQPGIEAGTPANAADYGLPLSHRDKQHHPFDLSFPLKKNRTLRIYELWPYMCQGGFSLCRSSNMTITQAPGKVCSSTTFRQRSLCLHQVKKKNLKKTNLCQDELARLALWSLSCTLSTRK